MLHLGDLGHLNSAHIDNRQVAVGDDQIAAAVTGVVAGGKVLDHLHRNLRRGRLDRLDDVVALDIGVLFDLVSHLEGEQGQSDALVVGSSGEPINGISPREQPAFRAAPEAYVVTL